MQNNLKIVYKPKMAHQIGIKMILPQNIIHINVFNVVDNIYSEGILNLDNVLFSEFDNNLNVTRVYLKGREYPILILEKL